MKTFLFVGLGWAGQRHLRFLREILGQEADIIAWRQSGGNGVWNPDGQFDASRSPEAAYGIRKSFTSLQDALAEKPSACVISTPSSMHMAPALAAARAGCRLLIEKPLSHSMEGILPLLQEARRSGHAGMVGFPWRFHPGLQKLRSVLQGGALGKVISARIEVGSYLPSLRRRRDRPFYAVTKELGGGVILTEIHELDLALWFFGMPFGVYAAGGNLGPERMDVEDTAHILLSYGSGNSSFPVTVAMTFWQNPPRRAIDVVLEKGCVIWDGPGKSLRIFDGGTNRWEEESYASFEYPRMFELQLRRYLDCLDGRAEPPVDLASGAESLRIALAAKESLTTGEPIIVK